MPQENKPEVISHPKSVELYGANKKASEAINALLQSIYDMADEKTPEGKTVIEKLMQAQRALETMDNVALEFLEQGNTLHSALVILKNKLPILEGQIGNLEIRLDRQARRHYDRQKGHELTVAFEQLNQKAQQSVRR